MNNRDDSLNDMDIHDLTDEQIERLIAGTETPGGYEAVGADFAALRSLGADDHQVLVSTSLGEFVSRQPSAPQGDDDILLTPVSAAMSPSPPRRERMLAGLLGTTAAKFALAGGVAIAGVTGAHATGLVDVPLLPDQGDPIEILSAGQPTETPVEPAEGAAEQPADVDQTDPDEAPDTDEHPDSQEPAELDGTINIVVGDASFQITIENADGDLSVRVDVEGVSPECEAAIESLEDLTDSDALETAGDAVEAACADDFADFSPDFGHLDFDADGVFGGVFGHSFGECELGFDPTEEPTDKSLDELLESCLPEGIEIFGDVGGFEQFRDQFGADFPDFEQLDELLKDLDLSELDGLLDGQDFSQLDELLEGLDLSQLDGLLEGQDFSDFEELFNDLGIDPLGDGNFEGLIKQFLEDVAADQSGE